MERFLTQLYQEEMDKTAEVELEEALVAQPMEVLEAMLGISKHAVAGPPAPVLPGPNQGKVLDARQKAVDEFSAKNRTEPPPTRDQSAAATHTNDDGEQKKAMVWADQMGRKLASTFSVPLHAVSGALSGGVTGGALGAGIGALAGKKGHRWESAGKGALIGGGIGGGLGGLGGAVGAKRVNQMLKEMEGHVKRKQSQGVGDSGGMGLAGGGSGQGIETTGSADGGAEMSTTASVKAKIASIALRATRGAPDHIRKVAAAVAGQKIAAVKEQGTNPFRLGR